MKYTNNYSLKKPEYTDPADIQDINDNADIIDQKLKENADALETHKNDNTKHVTLSERNNWNSKAAGNHNHDGVYEPVLSSDRKRKITFGISEPSGGSDGDIYFQYE